MMDLLRDVWTAASEEERSEFERRCRRGWKAGRMSAEERGDLLSVWGRGAGRLVGEDLGGSERTEVRGAEMEGVLVSGCDLRGIELVGGSLVGASVVGCRMEGAEVRGVVGVPEVFTGHTGGVYSVVMSVDGSRIVTASHDETIRMWDVLMVELWPRSRVTLT